MHILQFCNSFLTYLAAQHTDFMAVSLLRSKAFLHPPQPSLQDQGWFGSSGHRQACGAPSCQKGTEDLRLGTALGEKHVISRIDACFRFQ